MRRQYFFIPLFLSGLAGLACFAMLEGQFNRKMGHARYDEQPRMREFGGWPSQTADAENDHQDLSQAMLRQELMEYLDRLVFYENSYRALHGRFTFLSNRLGLSLSRRLAQQYEIRVSMASSDYLLVDAISERDGKILDRVSVDQDYKVHANFNLPDPNAQYLKVQAFKYLRVLRQLPDGSKPNEVGIYQNYFVYSLKDSSQKDRHAFAVGIRPPVMGVQIELTPTNELELGLALGLVKVGEVDDLHAAFMAKAEPEGVMPSPEDAALGRNLAKFTRPRRGRFVQRGRMYRAPRLLSVTPVTERSSIQPTISVLREPLVIEPISNEH